MTFLHIQNKMRHCLNKGGRISVWVIVALYTGLKLYSSKLLIQFVNDNMASNIFKS